jgi:hypothetical protein
MKNQKLKQKNDSVSRVTLPGLAVVLGVIIVGVIFFFGQA